MLSTQASTSSGITRRLLFLLLPISLLLSSCTTLQVGFEREPTPDQSAIGTLAALMLQGTQLSVEATRRAIPVTPTAVTGRVSGQICYPSERIPPMTLYLIAAGGAVTTLDTVANQVRYQIDLPPGEYIAFAWVEEYQLGGIYSQAVVCGLAEPCDDHSPARIPVSAGGTAANIDLCDWAFTASSLPVPPGLSLP